MPPLLGSLTLPKADAEAAIVQRLQALVADGKANGGPGAGDEVAGRYRLVRELGRGGMGVVWEGVDLELERRVAVKMITAMADPSGLARMRREARAVAKLSHPNVAAVYDVDADATPPFIVMEFVEGGDLGRWLRREPRPTWQAVLAAFEQAGDGLEAAHRAGLVHRDFKPANVILGGGRVRVVDFGLARTGLPESATPSPDRLLDARDPTLTARGVGLGTPAYMAPEQHDHGAVTPAADVFAFACSLYEGLYGERPYSGPDWDALVQAKRAGPPVDAPRSAIADAVPARLYPILVRGLAADPDARWPSMRAFVQALRRAGRRRTSRRIAALVALTGVAGWLWTKQRPDVERTADAASCLADIEAFERDWKRSKVEFVETLFEAGVPDPLKDAARQSLDDYLRQWASLAREACTHRGTTLGETMAECLARTRQTAEDALGSAKQSVDSARRFAEQLEGLPQPGECSVRVLQGIQARPEDPADRRELDEIIAWALAESTAFEREALARRVGRLEAIGHLPSTALVQHAAAKHASDAGDPKRALALCDRAFASATAGGAEWLAFRAARECVNASANLGDIGHARLWDGRLEALSLRLDVAKAQHVRRRSHFATALAKAGKLDEAARLAAEIGPEIDALPPNYRTRVDSLTEIGMVALWSDDFESAQRRLKKAYRSALQYHADDPELIVMVEGSLANAYRALERFDDAEVLFERSLDRPQPPTQRVMTRLNYSLMLSDQPSRLVDGLAVLEPARRELEDQGRTRTLLYGHISMTAGQLHLRADQLAEAREALTAALAIYSEQFEPGHIRLQLVTQRIAELEDKERVASP